MQRPVLVCFAGDAWSGNPHSRHHLMRRFAGEFEVLFVEGIPMRSIAGLGAAERRRVSTKLRTRSALITVAPHLHVLHPLPIPPATATGRRLQLGVIRVQIERALARLAAHGPRILWFSLPNVAGLRGRLNEQAAILYYQDRYDAFSHVHGGRLRAGLAALATSCEAVVATSRELGEDLRSLGAMPLVVPHGVDLAWFSAPAAVPDDLRLLERPLVGHVGLLDDHISQEALLATANALTTGTVALVGSANTNVARLAAHPRIALLGQRPYESMPAYIQAFECCLVPFKINRLTSAANPIKLREYLAAGRPVVSSPLSEIAQYTDVVRLADPPDAFASAVLEALAWPDDEPARSARRARVVSESWDEIAERLAVVLRELAGH